jgi:hypothetical protein
VIHRCGVERRRRRRRSRGRVEEEELRKRANLYYSCFQCTHTRHDYKYFPRNRGYSSATRSPPSSSHNSAQGIRIREIEIEQSPRPQQPAVVVRRRDTSRFSGCGSRLRLGVCTKSRPRLISEGTHLPFPVIGLDSRHLHHFPSHQLPISITLIRFDRCRSHPKREDGIKNKTRKLHEDRTKADGLQREEDKYTRTSRTTCCATPPREGSIRNNVEP